MDRTAEEIALIAGITQNEDGEVLNERKLHHTSDNIQHQREKRDVLIR